MLRLVFTGQSSQKSIHLTEAEERVTLTSLEDAWCAYASFRECPGNATATHFERADSFSWLKQAARKCIISRWSGRIGKIIPFVYCKVFWWIFVFIFTHFFRYFDIVYRSLCIATRLQTTTYGPVLTRNKVTQTFIYDETHYNSTYDGF